MSDEIPIPNLPLSPEEESSLSRLSQKDFEIIDDVVFSCVLPQWRKAAMIASFAQRNLEARYPGFSVAFFGERLRTLAEQGRVDSQGNLSYMRFSEVRLPHEN